MRSPGKQDLRIVNDPRSGMRLQTFRLTLRDPPA